MPGSVRTEISFSWPLFQNHHCEGPLATSLNLPHLNTASFFLSFIFNAQYLFPANILSSSSQFYSKEDESQITRDNRIFRTLHVYLLAPQFITLSHDRSERADPKGLTHAEIIHESSHEFLQHKKMNEVMSSNYYFVLFCSISLFPFRFMANNHTSTL